MLEKVEGSVEEMLGTCDSKFDPTTIFLIFSEVCRKLIAVEEAGKAVPNFDLSDVFVVRRFGKTTCCFLDPGLLVEATEAKIRSSILCTLNFLKKISVNSRILRELVAQEQKIYKSCLTLRSCQAEVEAMLRHKGGLFEPFIELRLFGWELRQSPSSKNGDSPVSSFAEIDDLLHRYGQPDPPIPIAESPTNRQALLPASIDPINPRIPRNSRPCHIF